MKSNLYITAACVACSMMISTTSEARPVSYQGGWTLIQESDWQTTSGLVHYTITPKISLGARVELDHENDTVFYGGQATYLVKRWFGKDHQANLYAFTGAGIIEEAGSGQTGSDEAVFVGAMADWETRRWFVSYGIRGFDGGDIDKSFMQMGRVGVAPYVANTDALHTWLMLQVHHRPDNAEPLSVAPLVRFFKGAALVEAGYNLNTEKPLLNFTYRF